MKLAIEPGYAPMEARVVAELPAGPEWLVAPGDWRALADVFLEMAGDPAGTIDRWRCTLPRPRTMDEVAAEYLTLYRS